MKKIRKIIIVVAACFLICTNEVVAQTIQYTGVVRNNEGTPLYGATIKIQNSHEYATTDSEGRFYINTDKVTGNIICSYIGYKNKIVPLKADSDMTVRLIPDISCSDELMNVSLDRKESRISYTGAISTVKSEEIKTWQSSGLVETLKGKLAGYDNGHIRGLNSMNGEAILIVLDGVPAPSLDLSSIDPDIVESVSILKDAAAKALYGPLGAQGVILVTTKKGVSGKTKVNVNANFALQSPTVMADMLNSYDYAVLRNNALTNDGLPAAFSDDELQAFANGIGTDNDWRKMFLKKVRNSQRYNIGINGGNEKVRYYVNAGYANLDGTYNVDWTEKYNPEDYTKHFTLASNIDVDLFSFMSAFLNTNMRLYRINNTAGGDILYKIYSTPNTVEGPLSEDGKIITTENFPNPIYGSINYSGVNLKTSTDVNTKFGVNLDLGSLTKGLSMKGILGYETYYIGTRIGSYNYTRYVRDETGDLVQLGTNEETALSWSKASSMIYFMNFQGIMEYNRNFGANSVEASLNYLAEDRLGNSYSSSWLLPFKRIQLGGHAKYGYDNRYFLQFDFTHAGSEQMIKGNQFHFSPTISGAWVVSNEDFMKDMDFIDLLKFRGSFGALEYDNLWNFSSRYLYANDVREAEGSGLINSIFTCALVTEGNLGNSEIEWEKSYQQNYGVDLTLLNAVNLSVDYWRTNQRGVLCQSELTPELSGFSSSALPYENVGKILNQGIDIETSYNKNLNSGLGITVSGDFSWNKNKIIDADDLNYSDLGYYYPYRKTGYSIGQVFGYLIDYSNGNGYFNSGEEITESGLTYQGTAPRVGDFIYKDLNNDGLIDERDKAPLDGVKTMPNIMAGASVKLTYKNFDLYVQLQGEAGRNAVYSGLGVYENIEQGVYLEMHKHAWTSERYTAGEEIDYPALTSTTSSSLTANSFFVSKADYLRLKNVTFGYSLPKKIVDKMKIDQFRFYVTGQNLLTMTDLKFKGFDPECSNINSFVYRMFNLGLNINF
ncbi:MAG: SusC/RagA family TonB-linked outer membrane protein [Paludibacter sp.]|nr:SusC/RagA family TonB-linked outer membrane protein [Paludibacter sp.]